MRRIVVLILGAGLLATCYKPPPPQGGEGQACYPNDTCNASFDCIDGRCVGPGPDCGNGVCGTDETALSCPVDCGDGICGNGVVEGDADEVCDGSDLDGQTCTSLSYLGGTLACGPDCTDFNDADCHSCGDSVIQIPEVCDASNLGGLTCLDVGFLSGTLACSTDCLTHDISGCTNTCEETDCSTCISSACAGAACTAELATCAANPDCLSLHDCLDVCVDLNCQTICNTQFPLGVTDYMAARSCLICDPDICYDECDGASECL